jgi:hypothetical protein
VSQSASKSDPLPQWQIVGTIDDGVLESTDAAGTVWRLWWVEVPPPHDPYPQGYRLAPRDEPIEANFISGEHGPYFAMRQGSLRVAETRHRIEMERRSAALRRTLATGLSVDCAAVIALVAAAAATWFCPPAVRFQVATAVATAVALLGGIAVHRLRRRHTAKQRAARSPSPAPPER